MDINASSRKVRLSTALSAGEKHAIASRKEEVKKSLAKLNITGEKDKIPTIAVLGSGGALRAMIALYGTLTELKNQNLLDSVMYLSGVSGSTWCMTELYKHEDWSENIKNFKKNQSEKLTRGQWDFWRAQRAAIEAAEDKNYSLTDFWSYFIVYKLLKQMDESKLSEQRRSSENGKNPYPIYAAVDYDRYIKHQPGSWYEFTPHEVGIAGMGASIDTKDFGSKFDNGHLKEEEEEKIICYLQGLWGSALGSKEEIEKEEMKKTVFESLVDLFHYVTRRHIFSREFSTDLARYIWNTLKCLHHWTWGTTNNFLYNCSAVHSPELTKEPVVSLIDAGVAINTAFPLVLRPEREVQLILSFDFSSGDPFATLRKMAEYCKTNGNSGLRFPKIDESELQDKNNPSDCYIFRGEGAATVMHFPLFNKVNCPGKIEEYRKQFSTFKTDYSMEEIEILLTAAAKNVKNVHRKILEEIRRVVNPSSPKCLRNYFPNIEGGFDSALPSMCIQPKCVKSPY